jgi:hypothetical protein
MERGTLSFMRITEELLEWKSSGSGPRKSRLTAVGILCADHATSSIRKTWHQLCRHAAVARSVLLTCGLKPRDLVCKTHCGVVAPLWTMLLTWLATCVVFVDMYSVDILNGVYISTPLVVEYTLLCTRHVIDTKFTQREWQVERHLRCQGIRKEGGSERRSK